MNWSAYEVFSVISGIMLFGAGIFINGDDFRARDRLPLIAGGAFFVGYGFYVANQTSGVWRFPVVIFAVPFVFAFLLIRRMVRGPQAGDPSATQRAPEPRYPQEARSGHAPAPVPRVGAGILRDGAVVRALETYGWRQLAGVDPWVPATEVLAPLRDGIVAAHGRPGAALFLDELLRVARLSPAHGVGVWRFAAQYGPVNWRKTGLPAIFLESLRRMMDDPASPAIVYRLDDFESDEVRHREPHSSPLWGLVTPRVTDLEPQQPPAVGAEPTVPDLADGERRLLARIGGNELLAHRTPAGLYTSTMVRANPEPWVAPMETYAESDSLIGLLRVTGERVGPLVMHAVVSDDLAPYLTYRWPSWWPGANEPGDRPGHRDVSL